jgi:(1->4)-alpha-D-glucan 1-alpha-D-glucosylmutase
LRRRDPDLFAHGSYVPIEVAGRHADRVLAFARVHGGRWVIAAVPRLTEGLGGWGDTRLVPPAEAPPRWNDALTGEEPADLTAEALFATLPAALLTAA